MFELQVAASIDMQNRLSALATADTHDTSTHVMERGRVGSAAFIRAAASMGTMSLLQQDLCSALNAVTGAPPVAGQEMTLYIDASPELCLERIRDRNRDGEEGITLEYLQTIDDCYRTEIDIARGSMPVAVVRLEDHWTIGHTTAMALKAMEGAAH